MAEPTIRPIAVVVVERIDCGACNGTGYEPGHQPTTPGVPYRWCATCQGAQVRHRAMPLAEFAKLFTYGDRVAFDVVDGPNVVEKEIRLREPVNKS